MSKTQFELDLAKPLNINGASSSKAWFNLVVSIRDVKLWKIGMKPHRHWKVTDVKRYFGIKGNVDSLISQLEAMRDLNRK